MTRDSRIACTALMLGCGCGYTGHAAPDAGASDGDGDIGDGLDAAMFDAAGGDTRWANAVVSSDVPTSWVTGENGRTYENRASDPSAALGAPDGESVALGFVGNFVVFDLGEGEEATDEAGDDLVVEEFGPPFGAAEPYRVSISDSPDGPFVDLGDGAAESFFDLGGTSLRAARYVRVESQATIEEVLDGPGSPSYPGPEIDAVGTTR